MAKLNQIIAVEKSVKSQSFQELTEAHQQLQKPALRAFDPRSPLYEGWMSPSVNPHGDSSNGDNSPRL